MVEIESFAGNTLNIAYMAKLIFDKIRNIVRKEENASNQHFYHFPLCFQKPFSSTSACLGGSVVSMSDS